MAYGYKVPGSGRQKGTPNKKTVEKQQALSVAAEMMLGKMTDQQAALMTPRDVMRLAMRHFLVTGQLGRAHVVAVDLAPYEHPRLSAVMVESAADAELADMSDSELQALLRRLRRVEPAKAN
jgi:hypothetical protein